MMAVSSLVNILKLNNHTSRTMCLLRFNQSIGRMQVLASSPFLQQTVRKASLLPANKRFDHLHCYIFKYTAYPTCKCIILPEVSHQYYSTDRPCTENEPEKKLTLIQRFKQMYRDYWYVLVPVHAVTSLAWFGGFYYLLQSGVDVVAILESYDVSETLLKPLRDSKAGYLAISYALYKIFTPIRYTVTLGGTTISINYLKKWGYIKPIPSRDKLKEMYQERKDNLLERKENIMETVRETKAELKERKDNIIESVRETAEELKHRTDELNNRATANTSAITESDKREAK